MENGKAEGEGDLESMGVAEDEILHGVGGGWSRQTSQTKQHLSEELENETQRCSWGRGRGSGGGEPAPGGEDAQVLRREHI